MSYNFSATKKESQDLQVLQDRLAEFELIEFFPVNVSRDALTIGMSIPFKVMEDSRYELEVEEALTYLISEEGFEVTDLYTGKTVPLTNVSRLAKEISE